MGRLVSCRSGLAQLEGKTVVFGILLRHLACDGVERFGCLLRRDARFEPADDLNADVVAAAEIAPARDLLGIDDGNPVIGPEEDIGAAEILRGHADDREGMLIESDGLAPALSCWRRTAYARNRC